VTVGDVLVLQHMGKLFHMDVLEVKPNGAASIVETDVEIDFDEPLGYNESEYAKQYEERKAANLKKNSDAVAASSTSGGVISSNLQKAKVEEEAAPKFVAFSGGGFRIDGKSSSSGASTSVVATVSTTTTSESKTSAKTPSAFLGTGLTIASSSAMSISEETPKGNTVVTAPTYQSKIGDKYSKKKVAVSAFTGTANKLT
jgi:ubiquitin fusion degradation protein 1